MAVPLVPPSELAENRGDVVPVISYEKRPRRGQVAWTRVPGGLVVRVAGDIDLTCRDQLDVAAAAVRAVMPGSVLVEVAAVTFFGSEGLEFLARLVRIVGDGGQGVLTLSNPSRPVLRLVALCGMPARLAVRYDLTAS